MRLRLNQELRNKISSRWRVHAEQEETDEKEKYFQARENIKPKLLTGTYTLEGNSN